MRSQADKVYVLYVGGAHEKRAMQLIEQVVPSDLYTEVFSPKYQRKMKLRGEWQIVESPLVPGYLFISTDNVGQLVNALNGVPALTKLLGLGAEIVPLAQQESQWIERLTTPSNRTVGFSEGYIVGDRVYISSGPLQGYESEIVKIDRHKRFAYLTFNIMGRNKNVKIGLEIVSKLPA